VRTVVRTGAYARRGCLRIRFRVRSCGAAGCDAVWCGLWNGTAVSLHLDIYDTPGHILHYGKATRVAVRAKLTHCCRQMFVVLY